MLLIIFFLIIESQFCDDFVFEYEKKSSSPMEHWRIVVINEGHIIQNCEDYHITLYLSASFCIMHSFCCHMFNC
jgi:hypothetical protein